MARGLVAMLACLALLPHAIATHARITPAAASATQAITFSVEEIIGYAYAYEQATHHRRPPATVPRLK